jgi:hypothetical protein
MTGMVISVAGVRRIDLTSTRWVIVVCVNSVGCQLMTTRVRLDGVFAVDSYLLFQVEAQLKSVGSFAAQESH